jgi:hypothetical protein
VEHEGAFRRFVGFAAPRAAEGMRSALDATVRSFRREIYRRLLDVQPPRLALATVSASAPFRTLLPNRLPRGITAEDLAMLNHVELGDLIPAGTRIRVPR